MVQRRDWREQRVRRQRDAQADAAEQKRIREDLKRRGGAAHDSSEILRPVGYTATYNMHSPWRDQEAGASAEPVGSAEPPITDAE